MPKVLAHPQFPNKTPCFPEQTVEVESNCLCMLAVTYQYGVFLTLAGSIAGAAGGLLGLGVARSLQREPSPDS